MSMLTTNAEPSAETALTEIMTILSALPQHEQERAARAVAALYGRNARVRVGSDS